MKLEQFKTIIIEFLKGINMTIDDKEIELLYEFMNFLVQENKKINLTSIIDPQEIILKHFVDSLSISKFIETEEKMIDVGTGAGFPGVPLAICRNNLEIYLLDSLKKRTEFLEKFKSRSNLKKINIIWGRAEEIAREEMYRESFDVSVSRAVAPLNVLVEYLLPFVKIGGKCICMKGPNYKEELEKANNALKELGGTVEKIEEIEIEKIKRNIIIIRKTDKTNSRYPRKAGVPTKSPIV